MSITRSELEERLNHFLEVENFQDYGPNGLQIEGRQEIRKIAFAVSATADSIKESIEGGADALIVHHGLFWKFHGPKTLTKAFGRRVLPLVRHHINLFAYHLPLDAHPLVGNAATIAQKLKMNSLLPFGDYKGSSTGLAGTLPHPLQVKELQENLRKILQHNILLSSPDPDQEISSLGIITGGANGGWPECLQKNIECYLTGEMSEHDWHEAKESGIHMLAGGHHATEQFGILALRDWICEQWEEVETFSINSTNPA